MESAQKTYFFIFYRVFYKSIVLVSAESSVMLVDCSQLGIRLRLCIWWTEYIYALQSLSSLQKKKKNAASHDSVSYALIASQLV